MPLYYFRLCDNKGQYADPDGTFLSDEAAAKAHARRVAKELMHRCELKTRHWKLVVCDGDGEVLFDVPFAAEDQTLDHLGPELRHSVERLSRSMGSLADVIFDCRATVLQSRALLARADGKLYLAATEGRRI